MNGITNGSITPPTASAGVEQEDIQFGDLLQALRRRRRLALSVFAATLLAGSLHTAWQRIHNPVFQGSFKLLVSDPINSGDRSGGEGDGLENLAKLEGRSTNNTATLIQVLSSPLLLSPIERSFGLPRGVLAPSITTPKATSGSVPPGVLEVGLQWGDPVQGQAILEKISSQYLSYSLRQRQEKLTQGLAFLDQQAPELQSRVAALQNQLADFRQRTGFVEPLEQAGIIKDQQNELSTKRKQLEQDQSRLEGQAAAVRRGQLQPSPVEASSTLAQGVVGPNTSEQGSAKAGEELRPAPCRSICSRSKGSWRKRKPLSPTMRPKFGSCGPSGPGCGRFCSASSLIRSSPASVKIACSWRKSGANRSSSAGSFRAIRPR